MKEHKSVYSGSVSQPLQDFLSQRCNQNVQALWKNTSQFTVGQCHSHFRIFLSQDLMKRAALWYLTRGDTSNFLFIIRPGWDVQPSLSDECSHCPKWTVVSFPSPLTIRGDGTKKSWEKMKKGCRPLKLKGCLHSMLVYAKEMPHFLPLRLPEKLEFQQKHEESHLWTMQSKYPVTPKM